MLLSNGFPLSWSGSSEEEGEESGATRPDAFLLFQNRPIARERLIIKYDKLSHLTWLGNKRRAEHVQFPDSPYRSLDRTRPAQTSLWRATSCLVGWEAYSGVWESEQAKRVCPDASCAP